MPFVYSTLTSDNLYTGYRPGGDGQPLPDRKVLIKGGANLADKNFVTKYGVGTEVSEDELEFLKKNPVFQMHVDNKFIVYRDRKADAEVVAADMEGRDESSPLVDADFDEGMTPVTDKPKKKGKGK